MHAKLIVARVLNPCLSELHAKRAAALLRAVAAVLRGGRLSLSSIALAMTDAVGLRHCVKSVDRLLGNGGLQEARTSIYGRLAHLWLCGLPRVLLVVDWSDLTPDQRWHWLRASVAVNGRSVTLYEEVHAQRLYGNRCVHRRFLLRVARILPAGCVPIVMTDAGFHSTWFELVAERGWSYVGRIRGRDMVRQADGSWIDCKALYAQASQKALDLGRCGYVRSNCTECRLVLVKHKPRGRHRLNIYGKNRVGRASLKCAAGASGTVVVGRLAFARSHSRAGHRQVVRTAHDHRGVVSRHQEPALGPRLAEHPLAQRRTLANTAADCAPGQFRAALDRRGRQGASARTAI